MDANLIENNSNKTEKIGNVVLNYEYYDGVDYYSEGEAENQLLDLVTRYSESDYDHVISNLCSWNVMYHLSHIRENVISWFPVSKKSKVLEIGAGCGAITGILSNLADKVTCIELSKKRSLINATRHREYSNIEILVGNFETIEPNITEQYDYITLIGVLEYAGSYIHSEDPYRDLIKKVERHLAPGGKLIIAIENKYGLKYLAGCKEDHTGKYFEGFEGYTNSSGVETFSRNGLETMLEGLGLKTKFYYPYPDYKLPTAIYSDEMLPSLGSLNTNLRNFDNDRIVLFDECKAFDSIIKDGLFPLYSNSFLIVASKEELSDILREIPIFAKYSNERTVQYRTATLIYQNKEGVKSVYKSALHHDTNEHIKLIARHCETLTQDYAGTRLKPNKCQYIQGREPAPLVVGATPKSIDIVKLEYISGITLEQYMYNLCKLGEYDEVTNIIKRYIALLSSLSRGAIFRQTERFKKIFGERNFEEVYTGKSENNFDFIFSNIVLDKEKLIQGEWNVLDYEWIYDFPIPDKFIAFRGVFYFIEESDSGYKEYYDKIGIDIYKELGFSEFEIKEFKDMEHRFQVYIIGGNASLEVLKAKMPTSTLFLDTLIKERESLKNLNNPKIYYSFGEGFSDDKRITVIPSLKGTEITMEIPLKSNMRSLRIDPTEYPSIVSVSDLRLVYNDDTEALIDKYLVNGYSVSARTTIFDTDDAQIIIENLSGKEKSLIITYDVAMFRPAFYEDIMNMARIKQGYDYKEPNKLEKALIKLKLLKPKDMIINGYHYNVKQKA